MKEEDTCEDSEFNSTGMGLVGIINVAFVGVSLGPTELGPAYYQIRRREVSCSRAKIGTRKFIGSCAWTGKVKFFDLNKVILGAIVFLVGDGELVDQWSFDRNERGSETSFYK